MKFEYKMETYETKGLWGGIVNNEDFEAKLNQLGAEGWELVNSLPSTEIQGRTSYIISIFKRLVG